MQRKQLEHEEECGILNVSGMTEANEETMSKVEDFRGITDSENNARRSLLENHMCELLDVSISSPPPSHMYMPDWSVSSFRDRRSLLENQICEFTNVSISSPPPSHVYMPEWSVSSFRDRRSLLENQTCELIDVSISSPPPSHMYMPEWSVSSSRDRRSLLENQTCELIDVSISSPPPSHIYTPEWIGASSRADVSTVEWFADRTIDGPLIEDETFVWDEIPAMDEELINVPPAVCDSHQLTKEK